MTKPVQENLSTSRALIYADAVKWRAVTQRFMYFGIPMIVRGYFFADLWSASLCMEACYMDKQGVLQTITFGEEELEALKKAQP